MHALLATGVLLRLDVPATPSAQEAREAAQAELSKRVYSQHPSLWQVVSGWLRDHLDPRRLAPVGPSWLSYLIVALALVILLGLLVVVLRRLSRQHHAAPVDQALFDDDRGSASLTDAADDAARREEWGTAVVERFRAIIRSLDEHGLIEDYPGLTAHEAGALAAGELPTLAQSLRHGADLFDAARYGLRVTGPDDDAWMRALAEDVKALVARPEPATAGPARTRERA